MNLLQGFRELVDEGGPDRFVDEYSGSRETNLTLVQDRRVQRAFDRRIKVRRRAHDLCRLSAKLERLRDYISRGVLDDLSSGQHRSGERDLSDRPIGYQGLAYVGTVSRQYIDDSSWDQVLNHADELQDGQADG